MAKSMSFHLVALSLTTALATLVVPSTVLAAGTMIVTQSSPIDQYGSWTLSTPMGVIDNRKKERVMSIEAQDGTYLLTVEAPEGAITTIRFFEGSTLLNTTAGTRVSFTFSGNGTLRAEIDFRYEGIVEIESDPSGATFELKGPQGVRRSGRTPARFTDMPPLYFSASFGPLAGCQQPRPQSRVLRPNAKLVFHADYLCLGEIKTMRNTPSPENRIPQHATVTPPTARMMEEQRYPSVQLSQSLNQSETVAGSTVYVTIGVRNVSKTTIRNVLLSEQFDTAAVALPDALPSGGVYRGGNTAVWEIPSILAGQSFVVQIPVRVRETMGNGERTSLTARVSGDGVHAPRGELLSKRIDIGVATLPATGGAAEIVFLLFGTLGALSLHAGIRRRRVDTRITT